MKQYYSTLKKGLEKGLEGAVSAVSKAAEVAKDIAEDALLNQSKALKDYKLQQQITSCGPGDVWKIFSGTSKKQGDWLRTIVLRGIQIHWQLVWPCMKHLCQQGQCKITTPCMMSCITSNLPMHSQITPCKQLLPQVIRNEPIIMDWMQKSSCE